MATTLKSAPGQRSLNGNAPPDRFDLEPPSTGTGRSRWPEMAVGTLVVALFALAGAWFYSNASATEAVLSLRNPVERGAAVTSSDLAIVEVSSEDLLNSLPADQSAAIVGQIAMTDLSAGTLVTSRSSFSYVAALLSEGRVYYFPFWHLPSPRWICVEELGVATTYW